MSRRQHARRRREAEHWSAKRAAAPDAAGRAAVAFDRLRARLADLPADARDHAWERIVDDLDAWTDHYTREHAA